MVDEPEAQWGLDSKSDDTYPSARTIIFYGASENDVDMSAKQVSKHGLQKNEVN
jgi:hypothetical protein